jgi:hypothetical protein
VLVWLGILGVGTHSRCLQRIQGVCNSVDPTANDDAGCPRRLKCTLKFFWEKSNPRTELGGLFLGTTVSAF